MQARACSNLPRFPLYFGRKLCNEEPPLTLQITLFADDGILLASDTLQVERPTSLGSVETASNESKIFLNPSKTIAAACCEKMLPATFVFSILDAVDSSWEGGCLKVSECCFDLWKKEQEERPFFGDEYSALMIVSSRRRQVYQVSFSKNAKPIAILKEENLMQCGMQQGHSGNPAYFFVRRYLPEKPASVESLVRLAANYILMAARLNPYGIGGLEIYISRSEKPFNEVPKEIILQLTEESRCLDLKLKELLLKPLSISAS